MILIPLEDITYFLVFKVGFSVLSPSTICNSPLFDFLKGVQEVRQRDLTRAPHTAMVHCKERNRSVNSTEAGLRVALTFKMLYPGHSCCIWDAVTAAKFFFSGACAVINQVLF